jgi:hypothetical protein
LAVAAAAVHMAVAVLGGLRLAQVKQSLEALVTQLQLVLVAVAAVVILVIHLLQLAKLVQQLLLAH